MPLVSPEIVVLVGAGLPVTSLGVCAVAPMYGVTVYFVMALPPLSGAVHVTVAWPSPAEAVGALGVAGAVGGGAGAPVLNTTVAASQGVFAPVLVVGFGVAPVPVRIWSCASSSMSPVGETLVRTV